MYKGQREKYKALIQELYLKNVNLKEDFEEFDRSKDKYYLNLIDTLKGSFSSTISRFSSQSQKANLVKELRQKVIKYATNEKRQSGQIEILSESNMKLKKKNSELQKKICTNKEKSKLISPLHYIQRSDFQNN